MTDSEEKNMNKCKFFLMRIKRQFSCFTICLRLGRKNSIYFFTFHKCASTLFGNYLLKNIDGLESIDYANFLWDKPDFFEDKLRFRKKGYIYGPIRLSATEELVNRLLVQPTSQYEFIRDKAAIFFIRDPRDILVSSYYSFGFTHSLNPVQSKREKQLEEREKIQALTIDEYVLDYASVQVEYFNRLKAVYKACKRKVILRYEDMIDDFDHFVNGLRTIVEVSDNVVQKLYNDSRPKKVVDNKSHRRSGETQRYKKDLKPETIVLLNQKLASILKEFNYKV